MTVVSNLYKMMPSQVSEDFIVPSSLTLCTCTKNDFISSHIQNQHLYIFVNE
jgi:hypothetical protein